MEVRKDFLSMAIPDITDAERNEVMDAPTIIAVLKAKQLMLNGII